MTRTHGKVSNQLKSKHQSTPVSSALGADCSPEIAEEVFRILEGRWKLEILYHLFGGKNQKVQVLRFSELERAIPAISQKMLIQQLRELEHDGIVVRTIYPEVPPKVEYKLTSIGEALRPALRALVAWATLWKQSSGSDSVGP